MSITKNTAFSLSYDIFNRADRIIEVCLKGGIRYRIDADEDGIDRQYVSVVIESPFLNRMDLDPAMALTKFDRVVMEKIVQQIKCHREDPLSRHQNIKSIRIEVSLNSNVVEKNNGIHSEMFGFTLYSGYSDRKRFAQNTPRAVLDETSNTDINNSINANVTLIDPQNHVGTLWSNLYGKAVQIVKTDDNSRPAGLYLFAEGVDFERIETRLDVTDLNKKILAEYGIFNTKREAEECTNSDILKTFKDKVTEVTKLHDSLYATNEKQKKELAEIYERHAKLTHKLDSEKVTGSLIKAFEGVMGNLNKILDRQNAYGDNIRNSGSALSVVQGFLRFFL